MCLCVHFCINSVCVTNWCVGKATKKWTKQIWQELKVNEWAIQIQKELETILFLGVNHSLFWLFFFFSHCKKYITTFFFRVVIWLNNLWVICFFINQLLFFWRHIFSSYPYSYSCHNKLFNTKELATIGRSGCVFAWRRFPFSPRTLNDPSCILLSLSPHRTWNVFKLAF